MYLQHTLGLNGGLRLILDTQEYEYLISNTMGAGFFIAILDDLKESEAISDIAYKVSAGSSVLMGLKRVNYSDIGPPVSNCNETEGFFGCMRECRSRYILDQCGCRMEWMTTDPMTAPYCSFIEKFACADPKLYEFPTSPAVDIYCNCAPKCSRTEYTITTTISTISKHMADFNLLHKPHNKDVQKIARIQDLADIEVRYSNLVDNLRNIMDSLQTNIWCLNSLTEKITMGDNLSNFSNHIHGFEDKLLIISELKLKHTELISTINQSFFSVYLETSEVVSDVPDDLYVRSANDILRYNASNMKKFYSQIKAGMEEILEMVNDIQNGTSTEFSTNYPAILQSFSNITILRDKYRIISENLSRIYEEYIKINSIIQNDTTILNTSDWGKPLSAEFYQQNYVELNIYFESLSTTRISQFETDSVTSLICDLGGNLGLWLGGSTLTLFEILDLILIIPDLKIQR